MLYCKNAKEWYNCRGNGDKVLVKVLASGSTGNSTFLETANLKILIDLGISKKKIEQGLQELGLSSSVIDYVFLTHEHIDHINGLLTFMKTTSSKIILSKGTYKYLCDNKKYREVIENHKERILILQRNNFMYESFFINNLKITPLPAFHDAIEPVGYVFEENDKKVVYLTDTGFVHQEVMNLIYNATCYIFETNHDPEILMNSSRPFALKQRILSDHGHLSNADALFALANLVGDKTRYVFYAHISAECNLREIIDLTRKKIFNKLGVYTENMEFIFTMPFAIKEVLF